MMREFQINNLHTEYDYKNQSNLNFTDVLSRISLLICNTLFYYHNIDSK